MNLGSKRGGLRQRSVSIVSVAFVLVLLAGGLAHAELTHAPAPLTTPTYDGSGQTTEPDVLFFEQGWHGYHYWTAIVPYPFFNDRLENPSILASNDGVTWEVPPGVTNPLVGPPPCDHNNDPDLVYNGATDELWLYFLDTRRSSRCFNTGPWNNNYLKVIRSGDGVHWSEPVTVIDWPLGIKPLWVSPAVTKIGGAWSLWVAQYGTGMVGRATSSDGLNWTTVQYVNLRERAWHLNVHWIPATGEYWLIGDYPSSSGRMRLARSTDGVNWTSAPTPLLTSLGTGWDANIYRGSLLRNTDGTIRLWYSAYSPSDTNEWHTGYTEGSPPSLDCGTRLTAAEQRTDTYGAVPVTVRAEVWFDSCQNLTIAVGYVDADPDQNGVVPGPVAIDSVRLNIVSPQATIAYCSAADLDDVACVSTASTKFYGPVRTTAKNTSKLCVYSAVHYKINPYNQGWRGEQWKGSNAFCH